MALFDPTDTVDVPHPGGGTITLPASVAQTLGLTPVADAYMQGPRGAQPPPPGLAVADNAPPPGIIHGGAPQQVMSEYNVPGAVIANLPPSPPPPPPPPAKLATTAANIGNIPKPVAAPTAIPAADQAQLDAATTPATTDTLRAGTPADELNDRTKAMQAGAAAGQQAATNDAAYQTGMAHAYEQRNQELDKIYADQAKAAQANLAAINAKQAAIDSAIDAYGKTPLDRTSDHPILNAIGILMAGAGQGLARNYTGQNPAVAALDKALDAKVQLQLDQMKVGQQKVGLMRDSLGQLQQNFTNQNALYDGLKAAAIQKAINTGDVMAAQLKSQQAITNWQTQRAQMVDQMAQLKAGAVDKQHAADKAQQDAANAARHEHFEEGLQARAANREDAQLDFEKKKWNDQLDAAKLAAQASGNKAQVDQIDKVRNEGVFDPRTGTGMLDSNGRAKMAQADRLEVAARTASPSDAATWRAQAQALRQDAQANNVYTIKDPADRKEVRDNISANQGLVDVIQDIKNTLAAGPSGFDRDAWAGLKTKFEVAKADYIAAHGGKLTSREMDAVGDAFSADPDSFWSREVNTGKMNSSLDALKTYAVADATRALKTHGIQDQWQPRALDVNATTLGGQTSQEVGTGADLGAVSKHLSFTSNEQREQNAENTAPFSSSGLAPADESAVRAKMARFDNAPDAEQADISQWLAAAAQSPRESVANGVIALLREKPALYKQVISQLPAQQQAYLKKVDRASEDEALKRMTR